MPDRLRRPGLARSVGQEGDWRLPDRTRSAEEDRR